MMFYGGLPSLSFMSTYSVQVRVNVSCATSPVWLALLQGGRTASAAPQVHIWVHICCLCATLASETMKCLVGLSNLLSKYSFSLAGSVRKDERISLNNKSCWPLCWQPLYPLFFFSISCMICLSVFRSFFDCSTDLRVSLSFWYVCQQGVQPVWRLLERVYHVPGCPAVPALSQWALPAQWSVCGRVSEVLVLFSHFLTYTWTCSIIIHQWYLILSSLCLFPRGIPQSGVCQPCAPECTSCQGNSSYCLSCEKQYLLLDYSCRSHCPEGYYATETECRHCPAHCRECNQDGMCKSEYAGWSSEG